MGKVLSLIFVAFNYEQKRNPKPTWNNRNRPNTSKYSVTQQNVSLCLLHFLIRLLLCIQWVVQTQWFLGVGSNKELQIVYAYAVLRNVEKQSKIILQKKCNNGESHLMSKACKRKKGTQRSRHFWNPCSPLRSRSTTPPPVLRSAHAPSFSVTSAAYRSIPAHPIFGPLRFRSPYLLWLDILHRHHVVHASRNRPIFFICSHEWLMQHKYLTCCLIVINVQNQQAMCL
jgi:hypothetical protein